MAHCGLVIGLHIMTVFLRLLLVLGVILLAAARLSIAQPTAEQFATAVVGIESSINPAGRTVPILGDSRSGTGVVIDSSGLIVTVGYLLLEASEVTVRFYNGEQLPASVVAIDSESGLALLQVSEAHSQDLPSITPISLGQSALLTRDERVIALPAGGLEVAASVRIHSLREFSAPWEYLLEEAIYTIPVLRNFSGSALINRDAELVGIGTLALQNVSVSEDTEVAGNLFIPVDLLTTRLGGMLSKTVADGDTQDRPWLGLMIDGSLSVTRVLENGPAMEAGVQVGDTIVGVNDHHVVSRANLYRTLWSTDVANELALLVSREGRLMPLDVTPVERGSWLIN